VNFFTPDVADGLVEAAAVSSRAALERLGAALLANAAAKTNTARQLLLNMMGSVSGLGHFPAAACGNFPADSAGERLSIRPIRTRG
jgi:hypothetical protein